MGRLESNESVMELNAPSLAGRPAICLDAHLSQFMRGEVLVQPGSDEPAPFICGLQHKCLRNKEINIWYINVVMGGGRGSVEGSGQRRVNLKLFQPKQFCFCYGEDEKSTE